MSFKETKNPLTLPPLAIHKVDIRFWHAWQTDLRITKVQPRVWIYPYPDYLNAEARVKDVFPYDGLISLSLEPGTYKFSFGATSGMGTSIIEDVVVDRDMTIDAYLPPRKTVNVRVVDVSVTPTFYLADVKIECNNFVPKVVYTKLLPRRTIPVAIFDYGYDAYRQRVTVKASKPGYDSVTKTVNTDADNWDETILFGLKPSGWEPPPPKFEHSHRETYLDYEIHYFPTIPTYGVYLLPGESPPTSPVSLEKWKTNTTITGSRGIIDNLVGEPVFKQNYPPSKSHMDPGWTIWQQPGGSQQLFAVDAGTNQRISAYWSKDDLSDLLAWLDTTLVTTGHVWTYREIPIDFQLNGHVYYAVVAGHGKRFYDWAFQTALNWIDTQLEVEPTGIPTTLTINVPNKVASGAIFMVFGDLYETETAIRIPGHRINLSYNGKSLGYGYTGIHGDYFINISINEGGTWTIKSSFPGTQTLQASRSQADAFVEASPHETTIKITVPAVIGLGLITYSLR